MGQLSKKVGKRIKELRELRNIKQYELAEMLNMEPSNLTRIESGYQMPKEENISKIATYLNASEKDLFDFHKEYNSSEIIKNITNILKNYNSERLQFIYKVIVDFDKIK